MPGSLRRLALVPDPYPGESLLSWADALARGNQVSRTVALRMTGMARSASVSDVFGHHVSDAVVRAVRHTTGVTEEQVRGMTLARYAGRALDPMPHIDAEGHGSLATWRYRQRMVLRQRSNACPACLRENGARWLLKWRLAWSFACVRHERYLIAACRGCGAVLHPPRPGTPQSWICPGPAPGLGLYKPRRPCGRDIRRMHAKPVRDVQLLVCQQRIDGLLEGPEDLPQAQVHDIFEALYRSVQDVWAAVRPLRLPRTDDVVHHAWDRYLGPDGFRQQQPLIVAAAVKIATEAVPDADDDAEAGAPRKQKARPSWGAPLLRRPATHGEFELPANRFGGHCHRSGCFAWVSAGHGAVLSDTTGWNTYCPQHADEFTVRARSRERSGPTASADPRLRFLDARLCEEEQGLGEESADLLRQKIEAQRLIVDACEAADSRSAAGTSLLYAVRCLLLPYVTHPDFHTAWLPRRGEDPVRPVVVDTVDRVGRDTADHG